MHQHAAGLDMVVAVELRNGVKSGLLEVEKFLGFSCRNSQGISNRYEVNCQGDSVAIKRYLNSRIPIPQLRNTTVTYGLSK